MSFYKSLPIEYRAVGGILTLAGLSFIGFKVYRKIFPTGTDKANKEEANSNVDTVQSIDADIKRLSKIEKQSWTDATFKAWANVIYTAMDGVGTDFTKIENVIGNMRNTTDVLTLIKIFGIRNRKTGNPFSSEATPLNLRSWLTEELSDNEIFKLNKKLASKSIVYRF